MGRFFENNSYYQQNNGNGQFFWHNWDIPTSDTHHEMSSLLVVVKSHSVCPTKLRDRH